MFGIFEAGFGDVSVDTDRKLCYGTREETSLYSGNS